MSESYVERWAREHKEKAAAQAVREENRKKPQGGKKKNADTRGEGEGGES